MFHLESREVLERCGMCFGDRRKEVFWYYSGEVCALLGLTLQWRYVLLVSHLVLQWRDVCTCEQLLV